MAGPSRRSVRRRHLSKTTMGRQMPSHIFLSHGNRSTELALALQHLPRAEAKAVECYYVRELDLTYAKGPGEAWRSMMIRQPGWSEAVEGAPLPMPGGTYKREPKKVGDGD
jgi:hypothetical protein